MNGEDWDFCSISTFKLSLHIILSSYMVPTTVTFQVLPKNWSELRITQPLTVRGVNIASVVLLILQSFTHEPPSEDPLEERYQLRCSTLWTLSECFMISGSRHISPGKLKSPILVNELAYQTIQAQRKEEENGFASCLFRGSGAEDSGARGGAFFLYLLFQLTAKRNAAAPSFTKKALQVHLPCLCLHKPYFPKAALQENHYFIP